MSQDSLSFIMVKGGPGVIPPEVQRTLKIAACDLKLNGRDKMPYLGDHCVVNISTEWVVYRLGTESGVLFKAMVDDGAVSTYQVNFILSMPDVNRGVKRIRKLIEEGKYHSVLVDGVAPIPDLYEFDDLSQVPPPTRTLH